MRQGPHKNRSRSRGRRPINQSGRVYESNGPDVKVRGTAQTVADKYLQLARDALSAGDPVMAEGYFQHAEHYLRILAATQPYQPQNAPQRRPGDDYYEDGDEDDDEQPTPVAGGGAASRNGEAQQQPQPHTQPHPRPQPRPQEAAAAPPANGGETSEQAGEQPAEQPWGGPEPEFLRRGPVNGPARSRRARQPRSGNGRNGAPTGPAGSDEAVPADDGKNTAGQDTAGQDTSGQDTTEQA